MTNDTIYDTIIDVNKIDSRLYEKYFHKGGKTMADIDKLIQKMKRQPNGIRFQEAAKVLEHNGYTMKSKKRNIT